MTREREKECDDFFFGTAKPDMNIQEYSNRINDITRYYTQSAEKYKQRFYFCCTIRLLASSLIPIISLASKITWSTVVVSILAGVITISEGYINISRAYDKWVKYRDTCNALWIEQRLFAMKSGAYSDDETRAQKFVERCEQLMIEETSEWKRYIERAKELQ